MSATIPFLTEIDTRAEVKGSRDLLGLVAFWTQVGDGSPPSAVALARDGRRMHRLPDCESALRCSNT